MSRVLITGVAGLIGSHLSRHLLDRGHEVLGVDDFSGGYRDFVDPRVHLFEADITQPRQVDGIFHYKKPEYVYHLAAYAAVGLSPFIRNHNYTNNLVGSANVVNACVKHDAKKIVFTSSMDVYGSHHAPPYTEDFVPHPEDPYGIAKAAVEQDIKHAGRLFGLDYTIVRPHNVFGIYQNIWDKYRNVLGIWIRQTLSGQPLTVYGDGSQVRSFSDARYYMEPLEKLMTLGRGATYNLGADEHITILEAVQRYQAVANSHGYDPKIVHLEARDEVKMAYCDHSRAKEQLGFKDSTDFEVLTEKMLLWAMSQPKRPVKEMPYEIEKSMYSFWRT